MRKNPESMPILLFLYYLIFDRLFYIPLPKLRVAPSVPYGTYTTLEVKYF